MHIITQKRIWEAKKNYPNAASSFDGWYRIMRKNSFKNFSELKRTFNSVDKVRNLFVFDIGGNKLRLIANINFAKCKVYIRYILNHKEYEQNKWKLEGEII